MQNVFFTSDTHFGHANIIKYSRRPFADTGEMDGAIVERWNEAVGDGDEVWHLGDFTLRGRGFAAEIFSRLRGRIRVLGYPWHHDKHWLRGSSPLVSASGHPVSIEPPLVVRRFDGPRLPVTLCHYPVAEWDCKHHGAWHLHGHSHGNHPARGKMLDVGVDVHDFRPVALEALAGHFAE